MEKEPLFVNEIINENKLCQKYKRYNCHKVPVPGFMIEEE
jgi:hypothetical protein